MASDDSPPGATPPSPQEPHDPDRQTHSTHTFNVPYRSAFHPKPPDETPREPPKVTPIPKITSSSAASSPDGGSTHQSPASLAEGLVGKYVDEFGNILEWNGTVLGRAEGDLPSMVGRPVSETGEILDADGEVAGHVSENYARPPLEELEGGLRVDNAGNIYSQDGEVIGKLNEKPATKEKSGEEKPSSSSEHAGASGSNKCSSCNAPKPSAAPSPSEIYLDVKSTFDGIQLIIKIPTVFNREGGEPEKKEE